MNSEVQNNLVFKHRTYHSRVMTFYNIYWSMALKKLPKMGKIYQNISNCNFKTDQENHFKFSALV